jgi:hypothetical protein
MTINAFTFNRSFPPTRIINPGAGDSLVYNPANGFFENKPASSFAGATESSELSDFQLSTDPLNGDVLVYDGILKKWKNKPVSLGAPFRFTSLNDTNQTPQPNQYLKWNNFSVLDIDSEIQYVDQIPLADIEDLGVTLDSKADKAVPTTPNSIAILDVNGNLIDSGAFVVDFATAAQGLLADTAVQPGDNLSSLINDSGFITSGDPVSGLTNDSGFITALADDAAPTMSANLDVNNFEIISAVAGDIRLTLREFAINKGNIILDIFTLPNQDGTAGQILATDGAGNLYFESITAGVGTVFGRTGDILAELGDYTSSLITNLSSLPGSTLTDALNSIDTNLTNVISNGDNISLLVNDAGYITSITSESLTSLSDTPADYTGHAGKLLAVNGAENGVEFTDIIDGGSF